MPIASTSVPVAPITRAGKPQAIHRFLAPATRLLDAVLLKSQETLCNLAALREPQRAEGKARPPKRPAKTCRMPWVQVHFACLPDTRNNFWTPFPSFFYKHCRAGGTHGPTPRNRAHIPYPPLLLRQATAAGQKKLPICRGAMSKMIHIVVAKDAVGVHPKATWTRLAPQLIPNTTQKRPQHLSHARKLLARRK